MKALLMSSLNWVAPNYVWRLRAKKWLDSANQEPELTLLPSLCDPGRYSVDVGASMGLYTMHLLGYSAGCVSFEPRSTHAAELRRIFANSRPPVRVEQVGLSDRAGVASMRVVDSDLGRSTIEPANRLEDGDRIHTEEVPIRTLDSFELPAVGFIKIDVEGHEESVLRGAVETLKKYRPNLLIEMEERHKAGTVEATTRLLGELGYTRYFLAGSQLEAVTDPQRRGLPHNSVFVHGSGREALMRKGTIAPA